MMIEVEDIILLCAFRYALGRRTYITGIVAEEIERNWDNIAEKYQDIIKKEIEKALADGDAGDQSCDVPYWKKILTLKNKNS